MSNSVEKLIEEIKKRADLRDVVHHHVDPQVEPRYAEPKEGLAPEMASALESLGIERLYSHQAAGIDLVREGRNVVVMTPTASGKSLIYNVPVLESLLHDPDSRALYLYPLKGLEQDQLKALRELAGLLPIERGVEAATTPTGKPSRAFRPGVAEIYDGDTTGYRRKKIREAPPGIVLTNPDMLHLAINPFADKWEEFLKNLKYVVVDEVHTYRGVFGSHVAHVLRRLRRVAEAAGSSPTFIASSATIANPSGLAEMLTGLPFEAVEGSGAPRGRRNFVFINPPPTVSPYTVATRIFTASVGLDLKTITFTKSRKTTELIYRRVRNSAPEIAGGISSYRAGFLPEERREIEGRLFSGKLKGVISTSALELGVDIGGLDVCVLAGYPGTITQTLQRSGRVGRKNRDSLVVMVALADALDQYFMRNPEDFFRRSVEAAVLDSENRDILKGHLLSAATEARLKSTDRVYDIPRYRNVLDELEREGQIRYWQKGDIWYPRRRYPQRELSIRETGEVFQIIDDSTGEIMGESSSSRVLRELHPGAVYLHKGGQWRSVRLDMGRRTVHCVPAEDAHYHTSAVSSEETEIMETFDTKDFKNFSISLGRLRATEEVVGYRKKDIATGRTLGEYPLHLPASIFETVGVWMEVDPALVDEAKEKGFSAAGGLHALEHAAIAALPLYAMCDRMDLGGVSYVSNPELGGPAIFIYDGHPGGVGLARRGFETVLDWFSSTLALMEECPCDVACPSCTQDPHCGSGNDPLDKRAAMIILKDWLEL